MKVSLIATGKSGEKWLSEGMETYIRRLGHYTNFHYVEVDDVRIKAKKPDPETIKNEEGQRILRHISTGDFVVLLDERGRTYSSEGFADFFAKHHLAGTKHLLFIIGGAHGFSKAVTKRSNAKLSLSAMTFPHRLIRLFILEQIYRAHTLIKGEPYHHA